jgi:hypothetical protein
MSSGNSLVSAVVPLNCGITNTDTLMWISALIGLPQFPSLVLMLAVCGVLPEHWMIYLPHFFVDHRLLTRIRLCNLGYRLFDKFLVLPDLNSFSKSRHLYLTKFSKRFCGRTWGRLLPPAFKFESFREFLGLHNQISQTLSDTMNISSPLIVNRFPDLFTNRCQLASFWIEIRILRDRFSWLRWSSSSNSKMFFSIVSLMLEAWDPSHRWVYNGPNIFCILLLLMDPSFFPESRLEEIESAMRSILSGGDPSLFQTYLNVPFKSILQHSVFYQELKRNAPGHQDLLVLETMTLSDVLSKCGTFHDLSKFTDLSAYHMALSIFRWNIPNTFEILGNCFNPRSILFHRELIDDTHIIMCIMMYHSFLAFYERFCLPLQLLFHQEPDFRMSMMSIDIAYVPYQRIREFLFMIFPAFLMKMDIGQTFSFVSNEGDRIQGPHLLLAYFQIMYSNPNSDYLTEEKKMEMIVENLHAFSSQDPKTLLREYTRMFDWTASNQLMPCLFSMFLVNMFCKNVPKFLKELGLDLNAPPAYLSPVHSMKELLSRINIVSKMLGMPQLTDFSSFVEQTEYNWRLPNGPEQHLLREITDLIVPSSFKGPQLRANLQLEMRCELRPTLDEIISLLRGFAS